MADRPRGPHGALLHELAEGLQSTGSYLAAARKLHLGEKSGHALLAGVVEKAASELARAQAAFHMLRVQLGEAEGRGRDGPRAGEPAPVPIQSDDPSHPS